MPTANFTPKFSIEHIREMQTEALEFQLDAMRSESCELPIRVRAAESVLRHTAKILATIDDEPEQLNVFSSSQDLIQSAIAPHVA